MRHVAQVEGLRAARGAWGGGGVVLGMANRQYPHQTLLQEPLVDALLADLAL